MDSVGGGGSGGAPWRRQGSTTSGGGGTNPSAPPPPPMSVPPAAAAPAGVSATPPPPPPMTPAGVIPPTRLATELGARESRGPPMALAGAMMKEKKPFTYTPGKIDLSEIRNPRMARRLLMNSQAEGVTSVPASRSNPSNTPLYLPPAALAAMSPAVAIPVIPAGAFLNFRNKSVPKEKPQFMRSPSENKERSDEERQQQNVRASSLAPQQQQQQQQQQRVQRGQSPALPSASTNNPYTSSSSPHSSASDVNSRESASETRYNQPSAPQQQLLYTGSIGTEPSRRSPSPLTPELSANPRGATTGGLGLRPTHNTKAYSPAPGQNLGSIYIPPNEHQLRQGIFSDRPPTSSSYTLENHATCSPMSESSPMNSSSSSNAAATASLLAKAPTPWMNSYNRIQPPPSQSQTQSPLPPNNNSGGGQNVNVAPWGTPMTAMAETSERYSSNNNNSSFGLGQASRSSPSTFQNSANPTHFSAAADGFAKQETNVGVQRLPREDSYYNYVPSQSKSFKVIQQIAGDDDGKSFAPIDSRSLGAQSPTPRAFRQSYPPNLPSSPGPGAQDYISSYPYQTGSGTGAYNPPRMAGQHQAMRRSPLPETFGTPGQDSADAEQHYMTGNIRNLQLLRTPLNDEPSDTDGSAAEADQSNRMRLKKKLASRPPRPPCRSLSSTPTPTSSNGVNGSSSTPKPSFVRSRTMSPSPTPRPANCTCSCNCTNNYNNNNNSNNNANHNYYNNQQSYPGSESETEDYSTATGPPPRSYSPWPENLDPYDPYAYMQWYYWWYYNYGYPMGWNGYDYNNSGSRAATPNSHLAPDSSPNYKSDSEQSDKSTYYPHSDTEETLQSVARNISSYQFGTEENAPTTRIEERQGSVPRIIVNKSPDPSSPAQKLYSRDDFFKQNGVREEEKRTESKYVESTRKEDLAEMDARQKLMQEIRGRESPRASSSSNVSSSMDRMASSRSDTTSHEMMKSNEKSRYDLKSNENGRFEVKMNENGRFDLKTNENSRFDLTSNQNSSLISRTNENSRSDQKTHHNSSSESRASESSRFDKKTNHSPAFETRANENSRMETRAKENLLTEMRANENSRFDLKSNQSSSLESRTTENSRYDLRANENARKTDPRPSSQSSTLDFPKSAQSACDTEATQKSVKLERNIEESESETVSRSDAHNRNTNSRPHEPEHNHVIRNSNTRETVIPLTPSSSSYSTSSSELFSEREDNYYDAREDRGYQDEGDADIFKPYTSAGIVHTEVVEVDEDTKSGRSNVGFIEEPEADPSEEDAPTLVDEAAFSPGVTIEECYSSEEATPESKEQFAYPFRPPTRLSTIDEMTERSRTTFPTLDEEDTLNYREDDFQDTVEDLSEDEESNDENSSVSVIENKSDGHINWGASTGGESHADEASTTSSSDAEDENDDDPLLPTVTVQLPLKMSFSKSTSFRDVPAVLAEIRQESETKEELESSNDFQLYTKKEPREKFTYTSGTHDIEEISQSEDYSCDDAKAGLIDEVPTESEFSIIENDVFESEVEDEPVVSFTISLSRSTSKSCGKKYEDDSECGDDLEVDEPEENVKETYEAEAETAVEEVEVDFWGQMQKDEETKPREHNFWEVLKPTEEVREETATSAPPGSGAKVEESNFWDRGRTFGTKAFSRQFSWDMHDEEEAPKSRPKITEVSSPKTEQRKKELPEEHPDSETKSEKMSSEVRSDRRSSEIKSERNSVESKSERRSSESKSEKNISETKSEKSKMETKSERSTMESRSLKSEEKETKVEEIKTSSEKTKIKTKESSSTETKVTENKTKYKNSTETFEEVRMRNKEKSSCKIDTIFSNRKLDECEFSVNSHRNNNTANDHIKSYRHSIGKIPCAEENSDESTDCETKQEEKFELKRTTSLTKKEINERNIEIKETRENFRVRPSSLNFELNQASPPKPEPEARKEDSKLESTDLHNKMTRAEDLLWRIERFLQENLSLGSEDDSGVMTDISRQISDVDTDNDVETEVVTRNKADASVNRAARALKTQSLIETTSEIQSYEEKKVETAKVDTSKVVLRNFSSEKKSLRYQRAKTHSRLFQLLQDECHKDDDEEEEEDVIPEEMIDFENLEQVEAAIEKKNELENKKKSRMAITDQKDHRLGTLPEKMKGNLTCNTSLDSTSSSSGVLSPSSPVSRDQLLVDIINGLSCTKKKGANFPSKIFKLLQQKFGEEFYDTFECCEDDFEFPLTPSTDPLQPSFFESRLKQRSLTTKEEKPKDVATLLTKDQQLEDSTCSSNNKTRTEFLQVPLRKKKSILNRDPRVPKTKATPKI